MGFYINIIVISLLVIMNVYSMDTISRMRSDIVIIRKAVTKGYSGVPVKKQGGEELDETGLVDRIIGAYSSSTKKDKDSKVIDKVDIVGDIKKSEDDEDG